ncbi:hypothetical protein DYB25_008249 [Aphanomyces astaci]|uniref:START domain-containing protein n=1 Tax=Aphanomyces astaci TaxID=112090 RepID=A0A397D9D9_APHAT|nr:hypothetical protein DYB25_008249 [Aphanomyces astaci]RHY56955.1 hypothetical protein DYB34_011422 [Aphanomyces astaci]RHY57871.1 hypothetical protein DYB38_008773 [Aphanomyces astaci]RHY72193.1 hypothetical protein DYB30_010771 [Aphanomyces astaci]RHZ21555.1 hypothetical protein DYB26_002502 [Aphanomyces astaci]
MSSSSSYRQSLPLPPNFFTCPPLREDEIKHMKHLAVTIATEVVEHSQLRDGGVAWTLRADEGNMRFFKAPDPLHRVGAHMFMSVVEVAGTLDEVIDLFRTDTTFKAKEYVKRFGKGLLDAVNLYTIVDPTPDFPNEKIAATWFAMKSPFDKIVANRDCVMLECQHEFEWTAGRRAWVRGLQSVALPCCPDMQSTLGLVRSTQYGVGHVVLESLDRPGYLQISFLNHFDVKGTPPEWLIELGMKKRCKSILDIELYLREDRLGRGVVLSPGDFVPLTRRRHCFLCRKRFRPWTKRSNSACVSAFVHAELPFCTPNHAQLALEATYPHPAHQLCMKEAGMQNKVYLASRFTPSLTQVGAFFNSKACRETFGVIMDAVKNNMPTCMYSENISSKQLSDLTYDQLKTLYTAYIESL